MHIQANKTDTNCVYITQRRRRREMRKLLDKIRHSRTADAAMVSIAVAVFLFAAGIFFMMDNRHVRFYVSGGQEVSVEYGEEFTDPGASAAAVGAFSLSRPLNVACQGRVDTTHLGSYRLIYKARYKSHDYTTERVVNVVDTTPPEITLLSDPGYTPSWLDGYVEEGYTAHDAHDGDLTGAVTVSTRGDEIVYTVTDAAGNRAEAVRRPNYTVGRPELTLNGESDVVISARLSYADPGVTARDAQGNDLGAYVRVSDTLTPDRPGDYTLTYSVTNAAGESVTAERHVTVSGQALPASAAPEGKVIYLTFDDGPGPYTDALLDVLDKYGAKATFFVTGNRANYRSAITRAYNAGHSIGVHSYTHDYGTIYSGEEAFFDDFTRTEDMIHDLTGSYTQLCRFPGGSSNTVSRFNRGIMTRLAGELGEMSYRYFDWDVCSGDAGETTNTDTVAANIISGCKGRSCAVVLQHDIKDFSVAAVEQVLQWGLENGYAFRALDLSSPAAHHGIAN